MDDAALEAVAKRTAICVEDYQRIFVMSECWSDPKHIQYQEGDNILVKRVRDLVSFFLEARAAMVADPRVTALQDRLEMRHAWRMIDETMTRVEVELGSIPDGIECRDETIKLHDKYIKELEARVARLREALQNLASFVGGMSFRPEADDERATRLVDEARAALAEDGTLGDAVRIARGGPADIPKKGYA